MPTYRIDLAYDGGGFRGYARQPGQRTVQGELEAALARLIGPVDTVVAGRTDAGAHAEAQVVSFTVADAGEPDGLRRSLAKMLAPEIAVHAVREAPDDFNARFAAAARSYRYRVLNREIPDPLRRHVCWHVPEPLDVEAMNAAAVAFVGTHDFSSFCRSAPGRATDRTVLAAGWAAGGDDVLNFEVTATSFCHQMVRSLVALCVDVGRGRLAATDVPAILEARDRNAARGAAPPHGLSLVAVAYPEEAS